jgi:hypothetical protein
VPLLLALTPHCSLGPADQLGEPPLALNQRQVGGVSVCIFWKAALPEVLHGTINLNPIMFRLFENRYDGGWVFWFCHRADCNGDGQRQEMAPSLG